MRSDPGKAHPLLWVGVWGSLLLAGCHPADTTRLGSKEDAESVLLGEAAAALVRTTGAPADHRRGLGGTLVVWNALKAGAIDCYPEFTGTLALQILNDPSLTDFDKLRARLAADRLGVTRSLGYENNYAVGVRADVADRSGLKTVSDLARQPGVRLGFSTEFVTRPDGWPGLKSRYGLPHTDVRSLDHSLAYRAVADGTLDGTDVYTTDAEIDRLNLRVLADDRGFFPHYAAVFVYRLDWADRHPQALAALERLEGSLSEAAVQKLNGRIKDGEAPGRTAAGLLRDRFGVDAPDTEPSAAGRIARHAGGHLLLVAAGLVPAVLVGIPLGVLANRRPRLGRFVLGLAGLIQTVPALALLMFLLALPESLGGGLGFKPAALALFLYALLPIVRGTATGLLDIAPNLREAADGLGLTGWEKLRLVELPLAARSILSGVRTSAVITIGTATLGAFVDAGGLGVPIREGLVNNDIGRIFEGAVPATALALLAEGTFDVVERVAVPRGLRVR